MLREAIVSVFTVALIALGIFLLDIIRGAVFGNWRGIVSGFLASIAGIVVALAVLIITGLWLVRDDRARRREESRRHSELVTTINECNKAVLRAIQQIGGQDNKNENNQD